MLMQEKYAALWPLSIKVSSPSPLAVLKTWMCPETKKRPKKSVLWAELETFNHSSPQMTCSVTAFTYTTSLDQSQCQVLIKGKQKMKLELLNRRQKVLRQGYHHRKLQPLVAGEVLALPAEMWHWMRMIDWIYMKGKSQPSKEIWHMPTPLLLRPWIQAAEKMGRERKCSF